jgi:hypothetical protein
MAGGTMHELEQREDQSQAVLQAIVATIAYADVFDYPLTPEEIHRYLIGRAAQLEEIRSLIETSLELRIYITRCDGFVMLSDRERIALTRRKRAVVAGRMWSQARRYGQLIADLPFVRMVAVTGALAVDNVEQGADIDYLVITEPGRLWICRLLTIALVRAAALRGDIVCPNYFLAETALTLDDQSLYTAHELAQMVPLSGMATYQRMRKLNDWADQLLPNANSAPQALRREPRPLPMRRLAETALRSNVGTRFERWEMQRKMQKFALQGGNLETAFSPDWCKGHFDGHGQRVQEAYTARLRSLNMGVPGGDWKLEVGDQAIQHPKTDAGVR